MNGRVVVYKLAKKLRVPISCQQQEVNRETGHSPEHKKPQRQSPTVTHFLQHVHTLSNKATPPNHAILYEIMGPITFKLPHHVYRNLWTLRWKIAQGPHTIHECYANVCNWWNYINKYFSRQTHVERNYKIGFIKNLDSVIGRKYLVFWVYRVYWPSFSMCNHTMVNSVTFNNN